MQNDQDPIVFSLKHGDAYLLPPGIYVILFQYTDLQRFAYTKL